MIDQSTVSAEQHEAILIIDDEAIIRQLLRDYFSMENFPVFTAATGEEGVELFRRERPSIVLTDVRMPGMDGLSVLRSIRREDDRAKVVVMTGYGDGAVAVDALRAGASNFVKKPLSLEEILFIVRAHERMLQAEKRQKLPPGCFVSEKKILHLTTNPAIVYSAVHAATHTLEDFLSRQEIESMSLALSEALINAVEHGNLAIGYEDKSEALRENRYQALLDERIQNSRLGSRVVKLEIDLTPKRAIFSIEDEGDGFDWSNRPDPTDPENLLREHGRGLSIINLFMDEVWFNEKGNRIGMLKRLAEQNEDAVE